MLQHGGIGDSEAELAGFHPTVEDGLLEWNYGRYEGLTTAEVRKDRPEWNLFRDGCPEGESPADIAGRVDRLIGRLRTLSSTVLLFAHGHVLRVLAARWVGQPVTFAGALLLSTATVSTRPEPGLRSSATSRDQRRSRST